jgi:hypothetical protein
MEKQITIISILNIAFGFLGFILAIIIFSILSGIGFISGNENALLIMATIGSIIGFFLIITSIPEIIGGIGLMKYQNWARILILIISFIDLINFPFGTAIGIYSIWVLIQNETIELFKIK